MKSYHRRTPSRGFFPVVHRNGETNAKVAGMNGSVKSHEERNRDHYVRRAPRAEVYGFIGWATSGGLMIIYMLWAFVPESILHDLRITYYPSKYWSKAIPAYLCITFMNSFFILMAYSLWKSVPLDSENSYRDHLGSAYHRSNEELQVPPMRDLEIDTITDLILNAE